MGTKDLLPLSWRLDSESFSVCKFVQKVVVSDEMFSQPVTQKRADMLFIVELQSDLFPPLVQEYKSNLDWWYKPIKICFPSVRTTD